MVRRLVRHEQFGEGRVVAQDNGTLRICFFERGGTDSEQAFAGDALERGFLTLVLLEKGRRCQGPQGKCAVVRALSDARTGRRSYEVLYASGVSAVCSEAELEPERADSLPTPGSRLAVREICHLVQFRSREAFRQACVQNLRQGGHLAALLSARVDLHPHQAFVAGTVLDDRRRRYILADEVGLGKTIEAGVVIHDLLAGYPAARVLIVCPGTLTQQWFCEIYSKFGGRIFTLLDLHEKSGIRWETLQQVIVSMSQVLQFAAEPLLRGTWDLVVIDECHHLLARPVLYQFAAELSRRCRSLLLLSAIPAQQREAEYFKLLSLLEPDKFDAASPEAAAAFTELFENQGSLSRRLQPLIIRMRGLQTGDYTSDDVVRQARKLLDLPILSRDALLLQLYQKLAAATSGHGSLAQQIVDSVADRYRVYRRILRNRRKSLQQDQKLDVVTRQRDLVPYAPGDLERNALDSVAALLSAAWRAGREPELVLILARYLWQSLSSSDCALDLLQPIPKTPPGLPNEQGRDFLALGHLIGYEDWSDYLQLLQTAAAAIFDPQLLRDSVEALTLWNDSSAQATRSRHLNALLTKFWRKDRHAKVLVFAGYPGLAEEIEIALQAEFGEGAVAAFRADLAREEKEAAAARFRGDAGTRVLVCDETGGEGRNFEFADAVVHYDTPWQVSRVEQRIGRLDRIGRTQFRTDVRSLVVYAEASVEAGLIGCLDEGLNVYRESISGLEFSLRQQEAQVATAALSGGLDALEACVPCLREVARNERARDEYDALLDWASFNEDRAQRYLSVRRRPEVEQGLETAFVEYYQNMAKTRAASPHADEKSPAGLWRFDLDALRPGILPPEAAGTVIGTFRRETAQLRLDRAFFQVGNPFYDALAEAGERHPAYRTYAVQCRAAGRSAWCGFEFVYSCGPNLKCLSGRPDLIASARSYFPAAPVHIFLDLEGREGDGGALRALRQSLTRQNKGRVWVSLWQEREAALDGLLPPAAWAALVAELEERAETLAKERLLPRLGALEETKGRFLMGARKFRDRGTPVSLAEAVTLEALVASLSEWRVYQEGAGFLALNHELVRYQ